MISSNRKELCLPRKEEGAVMLVTMVMLLLVTLVTFAVMERSTLESQLATASEQKEITFQMAEGAISEATSDLTNLGVALGAWLADAVSPSWPESDHSITGYDGGERVVSASATAETRYLGNASTIGYSIRKGSAGLETYYYEAEAESTIANSSISDIHVQGVYVEAPRAN